MPSSDWVSGTVSEAMPVFINVTLQTAWWGSWYHYWHTPGTLFNMENSMDGNTTTHLDIPDLKLGKSYCQLSSTWLQALGVSSNPGCNWSGEILGATKPAAGWRALWVYPSHRSHQRHCQPRCGAPSTPHGHRWKGMTRAILPNSCSRTAEYPASYDGSKRRREKKKVFGALRVFSW